MRPSTMHGMVADGPANEALIAQMRRGALEFCVMSLLEERERYGFELIQHLAQVEGMVTSEGTIYPLLSRLRREGAVETTWRESVRLVIFTCIRSTEESTYRTVPPAPASSPMTCHGSSA